MIYCGQCGLQLQPEYSTCPRCGAKVNPDPIVGDLHPEAPTVSFSPENALAPAPTPQGKVSRPSNPGNPQTPEPQSAQPNVQTPIPVQPLTPQFYPNNTYGNYASQTPTTSDPGIANPQSQPGLYPYGPGYPPQQVGYPTFYPAQPVYIQPAPPEPRRSGCGLVLGLAVLLFLVVVGAGFVVLRQSGALNQYLGSGNPTPQTQQTQQTGNGNNTPTTQNTPTPGITPTPTATPTAQQSASSIVQTYYADINRKDYHGAYNLLGSTFQSQQSYTTFANGYSHTQHDGIIINQTTLQSDGTVRVDLTIDATEDTGQRTFVGYDLVGQENGQWKILSGHF